MLDGVRAAVDRRNQKAQTPISWMSRIKDCTPGFLLRVSSNTTIHV
jgi:hypothetical protein